MPQRDVLHQMSATSSVSYSERMTFFSFLFFLHQMPHLYNVILLTSLLNFIFFKQINLIKCTLSNHIFIFCLG